MLTRTVLVVALLLSGPVFGQSNKDAEKGKKKQPPQASFSAKAPPLSPQDCIKTMQIQKGYRVIPVLTEPQIHEPAAIAWDGNGRLYVVEMRTYMQDIDGRNQLKPVSRVSRHEDTNGDGIYDKHTIFADKLSLPRMVLTLQDRVIIRETNTLDLKSYQDTNGDGVADKIEMWHKGGRRGGNLEHQPSGLIWNIDNWLYTTYSRHRYRFTGGKNGRVIREPTPHGAGQWGLTHDNVGRIFYSSAGGENPATDFQRPIIYGRIGLSGEQARGFREVFPIDNVPDTQGGRGRLRKNNTLNRFTASCGQSLYRGDRMPADFSGDLIICEPVGRLIRRAKVINDNGRIIVKNAYKRNEFIRATDPNFRPVNSATGPDGCLYIVDMYRGIIQEGNWVRRGSYLRKIVKNYDLQKNIGRGRIYRVEHKTTKRGQRPRMLDETSAQLVAHLSHPNGWWRSEAQKLIVVRGERSVIPRLKKLATGGKSGLGRLHAYWTLEGLNGITPALLRQGFKDKDARVRAAAVRISESVMGKNRSLDKDLQSLEKDSSPDVKIQLMLSAGRGAHPQATQITDRLVKSNQANLAIKGIASQVRAQMERIIAERKRIEEIRRRNRLLAESIVRGKVIYTTLCVTCHGDDGKGRAAPGKKGLMLAPPLAGSPRVRGHKARLTRILLNGLIGQVNNKTYAGGLMLPMGRNSNKWIADVATYVRNTWNNSAPLIEPSDVALIRKESAKRLSPWTLSELDFYDPPPIKDRKAWKLTTNRRQDRVRFAVDGRSGSRWDTGATQRPGFWFRIELPRPMLVTALTLDTRRSGADFPRGYEVRLSHDGKKWGPVVAKGRGFKSVTEIELAKAIAAKHIEIKQTGRSNSKYWSIHELYIKGLSANAKPPASLADLLAKMDPVKLAKEAREKGDAKRGAASFYNQSVSCSKCHDPQAKGGKRLGPDLSSKRDGVNGAFLVESILKPSKVIRKGFEPLTVVTEDGLVVTGFVAKETKTHLTIREPAGGKEIKIDKEEIADRKVRKISVMPAGLANQLLEKRSFLDVVRFLMEINGAGQNAVKALRD